MTKSAATAGQETKTPEIFGFQVFFVELLSGFEPLTSSLPT